jgi:hypothetical protein
LAWWGSGNGILVLNPRIESIPDSAVSGCVMLVITMMQVRLIKIERLTPEWRLLRVKRVRNSTLDEKLHVEEHISENIHIPNGLREMITFMTTFSLILTLSFYFLSLLL